MPDSAQTLLAGCYTAATGGRGTGVTVVRRDRRTGALTARGTTPLVAPSYVALHPGGRAAYAVGETEPEGTVTALALEPDTAPRALGTTGSGGPLPCHVAVDPTGRFVVVANYGDGSVSVHRVGPDLGLAGTTDVVRADGPYDAGPVTDRQEGPHAHQIVFLPGGRLAVVDLGADVIRHHHLDTGSGRLTPGPVLRLPPGTGPRHVALAPGGRAYLVAELDPVVVPLALDPRTGTLAVDGEAVPIGGSRPGLPSAIVVAPDGRFVYAANRGPDTVSVLAAGPAGLREIAEVPVGAAFPRDLVIAGDHLYAAAQHGDAVTAFRRDARTGMLHPMGEVLATGSPTCLLPVTESGPLSDPLSDAMSDPLSEPPSGGRE